MFVFLMDEPFFITVEPVGCKAILILILRNFTGKSIRKAMRITTFIKL